MVKKEKTGFCEYCQTEGAIGEDVFLREQWGDIKVYICSGCEDDEIEDMELDEQMLMCGCSKFDPNCTHPNCQGYLS